MTLSKVVTKPNKTLARKLVGAISLTMAWAPALRAVVLLVLHTVATSKVFVDNDPELAKYESGKLHYAQHNGAVTRPATAGAAELRVQGGRQGGH